MRVPEPTMKVEDVILEKTEESLLYDENPPFVARTDDEDNMKSNTHKFQLLKHYGLGSLAVIRVQIWLMVLGMKYGAARKRFYTDNHEAEGKFQYRLLFMQQYLIRDHKMLIWIHITRDQYTKMAYDGLLKDLNGYHYIDEKTGVGMVEYHIDNCKELHKMASKDSNCCFGAYASVRRDSQKKMTIVFWHGECIFKKKLKYEMDWI